MSFFPQIKSYLLYKYVQNIVKNHLIGIGDRNLYGKSKRNMYCRRSKPVNTDGTVFYTVFLKLDKRCFGTILSQANDVRHQTLHSDVVTLQEWSHWEGGHMVGVKRALQLEEGHYSRLVARYGRGGITMVEGE